MKLEINKSVNTTVATITTPTYSSGVAGLNGVKQDSAFIQRCVKQTLNIGRNLKWQCRGIAQKWEARNDYQGASLVDGGIVSSATN